MTINYTEHDIESYLFTHPELLEDDYTGSPIEKWIGRQYHVPSGIIDLLGIANLRIEHEDHFYPVVVEIKNRPIRSEDLLQVSRYAEDIRKIIEHVDFYWMTCKSFYDVRKILVVPECEISNTLFYEANSIDVQIQTFATKFALDVSKSYHWSPSHKDYLEKTYHDASKQHIFSIFKKDETPADQLETIINESLQGGDDNG